MSEDSCQVTECIKNIDRWMLSNRLKLNGDKTQLIWLGTWQQLAKVHCRIIRIGDVNIRVSTEVACLGVVLGSEIKLTTHEETCWPVFLLSASVVGSTPFGDP